jgi:hypothetical protein
MRQLEQEIRTCSDYSQHGSDSPATRNARDLAGSDLVVMYGRSEEDWDQLADAGLAFLVERARLAKLTSYTELNATLERRTGLPGFDFGRADERAAMGHLLYPIIERNRPSTGLMISAPVP